MNGEYSQEISWLRGQLQNNPKSMLFARLAERYLKMEEVDQAIDLCRKGLETHSDYATAHLVLAKCYIKKKEFDEAERQLKKVLMMEPKSLLAHKLYSELMTQIGLTSSAEESYRRMLDIDPLNESLRQLVYEGKEEKKADSEAAFEPLMPGGFETEQQASEPAETKDESATLDTFFEPSPQVETPAEEPEKPAEETLPMDKETVNHVPDEVLQEEPGLDTTGINDEVILPEVETGGNELGLDYPKEGLEEEEARFSEILDDIFSPTIDEEERKAEETRSTLERVASEESGPIEEPKAPKAAPPAAPEAAEPKPPEQKAQETPAPGPSLDQEVERAVREKQDEQVIPEDFNPFAADETESEAPEQILTPPEFKAVELEETEQEEEDFVNFLSRVEEDEFASLSNEEVKQEPEKTEPPAVEAPPTTEATAAEVAREMPQQQENETEEKTKEKFVTPTLGEIYAAQGQYAKAINVFELLLEKHPENEWYKSKLEYLKKRLEEEKK